MGSSTPPLRKLPLRPLIGLEERVRLDPRTEGSVAEMKGAVLLLCAFVATTVGLGLTQTPLQTTACESITSCAQCAVFDNCVFCKEANACVGGNADGPSEGNCTDYSYQFCEGEFLIYAHFGCRRSQHPPAWRS